MIEENLGESLRRLREARRISLRTLAEQSGFSPSFLSQVENGQASPSISSMDRIAAALGVTLSQFFLAAEATESMVVRADKRSHLSLEWSKARVEQLSPAERSKLQAVIVTLKPGGLSGNHPRAARSDEFAYVQQGTVHLVLGDEDQVLAADDAVTIQNGHLRRWYNDSAETVRILIVSLKPVL